MNDMRNNLWLLVPVFLVTASGVLGQDANPTASQTPSASPAISPAPQSSYELGEVVVTAPKENGVMEGGDLDSLRADSRLADKLDTQGGVETEGLGIAKSFGNVSIRGSAPTQTLILLNGQRTNQGFDLSLIPTEDIERVEVIKGPEALAYGPDATGGVVNIITRNNQAQGGNLGTSVGDFGTYQVHGSTGDWNLGPWRGSLSGNDFNTNGYTANTDLANWELDHSSHFDLGADQLDLTAGYVYKNGGAPNGDSLASFDTGQFDTDDRERREGFDGAISGKRPLGGWTLNPAFTYNVADVLRLNPIGADNAAGAPPTDHDLYNNYDFLTKASGQWAGFLQTLSFGFEFRSEQVQGTKGLGDGTRLNDVTSFSTQGLLGITQALSLGFSGRLDWYNTYNLASLNPEGTLRYQFATGKDVYFEAGTGFRYPDFDELYHPEINYLPSADLPVEFGFGETGNPGLQPEKSVNLETGTNLAWRDLSLKVSGFANFYQDLIVPSEVLTNSPFELFQVPYWSFINVSQARILGFEASLNANLTSWLSPYASYTYVDSRNTQNNALIPARMRQKLVGGITFHLPRKTEIDISEQYVNRNPAIYTGPQNSPPLIVAGAYSLLNADFKTEVASGTMGFLSLKNILNQQYATLQGLLMPGRYFELGTTVNF